MTFYCTQTKSLAPVTKTRAFDLDYIVLVPPPFSPLPVIGRAGEDKYRVYDYLVTNDTHGTKTVRCYLTGLGRETSTRQPMNTRSAIYGAQFLLDIVSSSEGIQRACGTRICLLS